MLKKILIAVVFFGCCLKFQKGMGQHTALQGNSVQVYWEAVDHFHQKKYHAALPLFSRFLQTDGTPTLKENAHFYKAMTRLYLGRPHADMAVKQFVEDYPDNPLAGTAYFELANYFFEKSKFKMAALYYENVEKAQLARRQQMEMTFKRAYANFNLKRFQEALPLFNEIKDLENEWRHDAAYYAGYIEFQNGEYQKAVKDFKQATQNPAYGAALPYMISAVYFNQGDEQSLFSYALPLLEEEKRLDNRAEMQLMLAETYFKQREFEKASQWFDGYLKGKSKASAEVLYRSAFSSLRSGKDEQAVRDFKKVALVKDTLGYLSSYYLGQLYLKQGNKRFAQTAFNAARQGSMSPDIAAESTFNSGKLAFELNNYDQAIRIFREFQEKYPGHKGQEKARELLSQSYLRGREFNKAIREIEKVARRSPSLRLTVQKLTYKKGIEYFNKDRYAEALRYFDKSLAYPESDELQLGARLWRAEARSLQKEYAESIADYQWVLEHGLVESPNKWKATYGLAYAFFNTQDYAQAIAYFKSYVEAMKRQSDPMFYDDALMRLADCYFVQKGYQLSLDLYSQAVQENNPDVDYAYYQIGRVHGIEENYSDAKQYLEKVIQAVPRSNLHDAAVYELASFEASRGDYGSAVNYASSLIKESPQSPRMAEALELRANSYFSLKNFKKSTADYARVLTDYPQATNAQSALLGLQGVLKERGKEEDFPKYLSMYKKANPENEQVQNIEFETVKDLYFSQQYAKAAQRFTSYLIDYPNTPFRVEASYYLADCYYRSNKLEQAAEWFEKVVGHSTNRYVNRSLSRIIDIKYKQGKYQEAVDVALTLEGNAALKRDQLNAWTALMRSYYFLQEYEKVRQYAQRILEKGNVSANATNLANLYKGKAEMGAGNDQEAIDQFLNTLNTAKDVNGAEAQYLLAKIFYKQKKYEQSLETLKDLKKDFSSYDFWLSKGILLVAKNYMGQQEWFQAKASLQSLLENSSVGAVKDEARQLMEVLDAKQKEIIAENDSTQQEAAQEPDSLISQ